MRKFKKQQLQSIPLQAKYQPELYSSSVLPLVDGHDNPLVLYGKDWLKLKQHIKTTMGKGINISTMKASVLQQAIDECNAKLVRCFTTDNLASRRLDTQNSLASAHSDIVDCNGRPLTKAGEHQNCFVLVDSAFYIHPKVRAKGNRDGNGVIGVNHTSLSRGQTVQAAGSFVYHPEYGWLIENTSGHYQTQIKQLPHTLKTLQNQGVNLSHLTVRTWVPICNNPSADEADYDIRFENAAALLARTDQSKRASAQLLRRQARLTQRSLRQLSTNKLDLSHCILSTFSSITRLMSPNAAKILIEQVSRHYFLSDYASCVEYLNDAASQHTNRRLQTAINQAFEQATSNPINAYTRRYYDHQYSQYLRDKLAEDHRSSMDLFMDVIRANDANSSIKTATACTCFDSMVEIFLYSRIVGDECASILQAQDQLRAKSCLYAMKDRGPKKPATTHSAHSSIFLANQPLPRDVVGDAPKVQADRIADKFTIICGSEAAGGFSRHHADTPFVNSVSGSMFTLAIWLQGFIDHYEATLTHESTQENIDNIITVFCADAQQRGYHSMHELLVVLEQPEVIELFGSRDYQVSSERVLNIDDATSCMADALTYSERLTAKATMHRECIREVLRRRPPCQ